MSHVGTTRTARRSMATLLGALVLALPATALDGAWAEDGAVVSPRAGETASGYADLEGVAAELEQWATTPVEGVLAEAVDLGRTREGRAVPAIALGRSGAVPLAERATVFVVGGLDGISLAGAEAALRCGRRLREAPEGAREDLTFVFVPWAAPDALARTFEHGPGAGTGCTAGDADGDGLEAEDGPDDLDGDGLVLEMLVEDPAGAWTLTEDGRLPVPATDRDLRRFHRVLEGRDDDGDGRYNEDAGLGARLDSNFPIGWEAADLARRGSHPLSEPAARALASEILARRTALVLVLQGSHGGLAHPGGRGGVELAPSDRAAYARTLAPFRQLTGRTAAQLAPIHTTEATGRGGSLLDWCAAVPGIPALEVAPWGDTVGLGERRVARTARTATASGRDDGTDDDAAGPEHPWSTWLDRERGGMGFVDWRSVDLGPGIHARVGGWEPRTRHNPPVDQLDTALQGLDAFVLAMAEGLPRLDVLVTELVREGAVVRLSASVRTRGLWPTALVSTGRWPGARRDPAALELDVPTGARLLAGPERAVLPALAGGAVSAPVSWLIVLPEGASMTLRGQAPFSLDTLREVRP